MHRVAGMGVVVACCLSLVGCASKESYVAKGNKLFEQAKYEDAVLNYRKAIQKDPKYGEAHYRLGLTNLKQRDIRGAYSELMQAADLMPDNDDAKVQLGDLVLAAYVADPRHPQRLYSQLTQLDDKLLAKNPNSFDGLRFKGFLALSDRKPDAAATLFRQALQAKPGDPTVTTALADALSQSGQSREAETIALNLTAQKKDYAPAYDRLYTWYNASNRSAEAENILKAKVNNNPTQALYLLQLAQHYNRVNKLAEMEATLHRLLDHPKDFPKGKLQVGDFYLSARKFPEAIRYYQEAEQADAKDKPVCQKRITDALLAQGKKTEALEVVEGILKDDPKDESALRGRARLWLDTRKPENVDKALRDLTTLSAAHPQDATLWYQMGLASRMKGDQESARKQFQEAVNRRKDFVEARFELAGISLHQHRTAEAMQQANDILALRPKDPRARMLHAVALERAGNKDSARTELTQLIKDAPQYEEPKLELGLLALSEKKYQEAKDIFSKFGKNDPRAAIGLAATSSSEHQFAKALDVLNGALQQSPDSLVLREQLVSTAIAAGQYDLALTQCQKLMEEDPKSVAWPVRLGQVYELKGQAENAIAQYQNAQALAPKDPTVMFLLAVAQSKAGHTAEAKAQYQSLLKAQPDNWVAMNNLAFLLADTGGDLEEAMRLAQRTAQKFPGQPNFSDTIGYVYLKKGMRDSAVRTFTGLVQKYPKDSTFHYHLGMALLETGDKTGAKKEFGAALANHPAPDVEGKIRQLVTTLG